MEKRYLSMKELAEYVGLALQTLYNWKSTTPEKLPPHISLPTSGKRDLWRFDVIDVDAWMHSESVRVGRCP